MMEREWQYDTGAVDEMFKSESDSCMSEVVLLGRDALAWCRASSAKMTTLQAGREAAFDLSCVCADSAIRIVAADQILKVKAT